MRSLSQSNRLLLALVAGVAVLIIIGGALLGAYFFLSRQPEVSLGWVSPLDSVDGARVAPDLAVLSLAGEGDERVFRAAIDAGEKESAFAALAYSLLLPDSIRGGHWLLLAPYCRQTGAERLDLCYQAALDLATLSPTLNDSARADLSLQAARGYMEIGRPQQARMALAQVENIARHSLALLPAQRRAVLTQLIEAHRAAGDNQAAASAQKLLAEVGAGAGTPAGPLQSSLEQLRGSVVLPASVTSAVVARQQAAAEVAAKWFAGSQEVRKQLAARLAAALIEEDRARAEFYSSSSGLSPADRLALLNDQIAWLTTKYRIARGDYGASFVPTWEGQADRVRADLSEAYTQLINGYGQQIDALPPADAAYARVDLLRQAVLWSRLGLLPGSVESALSEKLADASRQLWTRQGNAGLTIVDQEVGGTHFYLLSGSSRAGVE